MATDLLSIPRRPGKPGDEQNQLTRETSEMNTRDFDNDKKWCEQCNRYQRYLMSVNQSYCIECGAEVRLFNKADAAAFGEDLEKRRWRGTGS